MRSLDPIVDPVRLDVSQPTAKLPAKRHFWEGLGRDLLTLAVIATGCLGVGLSINQFRDPPLPLAYVSKEGRMQQAVSQLASGTVPVAVEKTTVAEDVPLSSGSPQIISLAKFQEFVQGQQGVALDARPEIFHRLGHVPGALSLSREEFEAGYARLRPRLEPLKDQPVAVYCSDAGCEDSQMVGDALAKLGYRRVLIFKGGWGEWTQAGLPEEKL